MSKELKRNKSIWLKDPEEHDYPAAADYLELIKESEVVDVIVEYLKTTRTIKKKAKDILRASKLELLPSSNQHVKENIKKVNKGKKLSPVLLVRGSNDTLIIADGYHRVCAAYYLSEDLDIPCRLV